MNFNNIYNTVDNNTPSRNSGHQNNPPQSSHNVNRRGSRHTHSSSQRHHNQSNLDPFYLPNESRRFNYEMSLIGNNFIGIVDNDQNSANRFDMTSEESDVEQISMNVLLHGEEDDDDDNDDTNDSVNVKHNNIFNNHTATTATTTINNNNNYNNHDHQRQIQQQHQRQRQRRDNTRNNNNADNVSVINNSNNKNTNNDELSSKPSAIVRKKTTSRTSKRYISLPIQDVSINYKILYTQIITCIFFDCIDISRYIHLLSTYNDYNDLIYYITFDNSSYYSLIPKIDSIIQRLLSISTMTSSTLQEILNSINNNVTHSSMTLHLVGMLLSIISFQYSSMHHFPSSLLPNGSIKTSSVNTQTQTSLTTNSNKVWFGQQILHLYQYYLQKSHNISPIYDNLLLLSQHQQPPPQKQQQLHKIIPQLKNNEKHLFNNSLLNIITNCYQHNNQTSLLLQKLTNFLFFTQSSKEFLEIIHLTTKKCSSITSLIINNEQITFRKLLNEQPTEIYPVLQDKFTTLNELYSKHFLWIKDLQVISENSQNCIISHIYNNPINVFTYITTLQDVLKELNAKIVMLFSLSYHIINVYMGYYYLSLPLSLPLILHLRTLYKIFPQNIKSTLLPKIEQFLHRFFSLFIDTFSYCIESNTDEDAIVSWKIVSHPPQIVCLLLFIAFLGTPHPTRFFHPNKWDLHHLSMLTMLSSVIFHSPNHLFMLSSPYSCGEFVSSLQRDILYPYRQSLGINIQLFQEEFNEIDKDIKKNMNEKNHQNFEQIITSPPKTFTKIIDTVLQKLPSDVEFKIPCLTFLTFQSFLPYIETYLSTLSTDQSLYDLSFIPQKSSSYSLPTEVPPESNTALILPSKNALLSTIETLSMPLHYTYAPHIINQQPTMSSISDSMFSSIINKLQLLNCQDWSDIILMRQTLPQFPTIYSLIHQSYLPKQIYNTFSFEMQCFTAKTFEEQLSYLEYQVYNGKNTNIELLQCNNLDFQKKETKIDIQNILLNSQNIGLISDELLDNTSIDDLSLCLNNQDVLSESTNNQNDNFDNNYNNYDDDDGDGDSSVLNQPGILSLSLSTLQLPNMLNMYFPPIHNQQRQQEEQQQQPNNNNNNNNAQHLTDITLLTTQKTTKPLLPYLSTMISALLTTTITQCITMLLYHILLSQYNNVISQHFALWFETYNQSKNDPTSNVNNNDYVNDNTIINDKINILQSWYINYKSQFQWFSNWLFKLSLNDIRLHTTLANQYGLSSFKHKLSLKNIKFDDKNVLLICDKFIFISYYCQYYALYDIAEYFLYNNKSSDVKNYNTYKQIHNTMQHIVSTQLSPLVSNRLIESFRKVLSYQQWYQYLHQYITLISLSSLFLTQFDDLFISNKKNTIQVSNSSENKNDIGDNDQDSITNNENDANIHTQNNNMSFFNATTPSWKKDIIIMSPCIDIDNPSSSIQKASAPGLSSLSTSFNSPSKITLALQIQNLPKLSTRQIARQNVQEKLLSYVIQNIILPEITLIDKTTNDNINKNKLNNNAHFMLDHLYIPMSNIPWMWMFLPTFYCDNNSTNLTSLQWQLCDKQLSFTSLQPYWVQQQQQQQQKQQLPQQQQQQLIFLGDEQLYYPFISDYNNTSTAAAASIDDCSNTTESSATDCTFTFSFLHYIVYVPNHGYLLPYVQYISFLSGYIETCALLVNTNVLFSHQNNQSLSLQHISSLIDELHTISSRNVNNDVSNNNNFHIKSSAILSLSQNYLKQTNITSLLNYPSFSYSKSELSSSSLENSDTQLAEASTPSSSSSSSTTTSKMTPLSSYSIYSLPPILSQSSSRTQVIINKDQSCNILTTFSIGKFTFDNYRFLLNKILHSNWALHLLCMGLNPWHIYACNMDYLDGGLSHFKHQDIATEMAKQVAVEQYIGTQTHNLACPSCSDEQNIYSFALTMPQTSMKTDIYGSDDVWSERCTCKACGYQWTIRH